MRKFIFILFGLMVVGQFQMNNVSAGDRNILVERFTSSTCVPCRVANPTLEAFLNASNPDKVTNISYHMNWPAPGNDPMYAINTVDNEARRSLYGVNSIPDWYFDGVLNVGTTAGELQAAYNTRTDILSPVSVVLTNTINGTNVNVKAEIYCEQLLSNPRLTVQCAVIERVVYYNGTNGETNYTYVMRKLLPNASGTIVTMLPGDKVSIEYNYTMNPAWNPDMIKSMIFVQAQNKEVLQTALPTSNFNLISAPAYKVVNQGQTGSADFKVNVPVVASGFTSPVLFTYEVVPAVKGITVNFTGGNTMTNFPDSLAVNVTSSSVVPTGEYKIVLIGTSTDGAVHKTFVNYLVGKNYITVQNSRGNLTFKVDGGVYSQKSLFSWDLSSAHTLEATSPQTVGNTRYLFDSWSNGGPQTQTVNIGTSINDYTAYYKTQYRLLGSVAPSGIPVTISNSGNYLDSASNNNINLSAYEVEYNGRTYYFNRWEGTGTGSYTGPNHTAAITMSGFILQKAVFDTIDVGISNYSSVVPDKFALYQNYPNPFNPTTNIKFDIAKSSITSLVIYDMLGKEVAKLVNEVLSPGSYQFSFNASNYPSGIYYYKVKTDAFTEIKKMILLK